MSETITRRVALRTGGLAAIAAGLLGTTMPTSAQPAGAPIDRAEAHMLEIERILLEVDEWQRTDILVELERLEDIAKAGRPHEVAASRPRNTGLNRSSIVDPWSDDD